MHPLRPEPDGGGAAPPAEPESPPAPSIEEEQLPVSEENGGVAPGEGEGESVPGEEEDAAQAELREAWRQLRETNPELAQELLRDAAPEASVDEDRLKFETEQFRRERLGQVAQIANYAQQYSPERFVQAAYQDLLGQLRPDIDALNADLRKQYGDELGEAISAEGLAEVMANWAAGHLGQAFPRASSWGASFVEDRAMTALEDSPAHRYLTAEERKQLREDRRKPAQERVAQAISVYMQAAMRGAPQERKRQEHEAKEKKQREAESALKLAQAIGKGGNGVARRTRMDNSDEARLERLAYGRDKHGRGPTEEDRAWLASRN